VAARYIIEAVRQANDEAFEAVILAAFCDSAIEAVREVSTISVYGLEETPLAVAMVLGNKFGILTEEPYKTAVKMQHGRGDVYRRRGTGPASDSALQAGALRHACCTEDELRRAHCRAIVVSKRRADGRHHLSRVRQEPRW